MRLRQLFVGTALFALTQGLWAKAVNPLFDNFVVVGDSLSHGAQSMSVDETRQTKSFVALMAKSMNTTFKQPLLKYPGFFVNLEDLGKGNIKWYQYAIPLAGGARTDNYRDQAKLNNYALGGASVANIFETRGGDALYNLPKLVLGKNGAPQLDQALARNPTFMSAWLGGNDVLAAAIQTDPTKVTPHDVFVQRYNQYATMIANTPSVKGAVIGTIPDCSSVGYLQPADNPKFAPGSKKAFWNTTATEDDEVLDPNEFAIIGAATQKMNAEITRVAAANGWAVVDAYAFLKDLAQNGRYLRDAKGNKTSRFITADYLGGFFSLDGFHPSVTGHAVMANEFVAAINGAYGTKLAGFDEYAASEGDSLYKKPYDPRQITNSWYGQTIQVFIQWFDVI